MEEPPQVDPLRLWRELLALRLPNPHCPMCGSGDWHELEPETAADVGAVGFACANCGFIRLHRRDLETET